MRASRGIHLFNVLIYFTFVDFILSQPRMSKMEVAINNQIKRKSNQTIVSSEGKCTKTEGHYYTQEACLDTVAPRILKQFSERSSLGKDKSWTRQKLLFVIDSSFSFEYHGVKYNKTDVYAGGYLQIHEHPLGVIKAMTGVGIFTSYEIISRDELIAVRWSNLLVDSTQEPLDASVLCTIDPEGIISIYYENIPSDISSTTWTSSIEDGFEVETGSDNKMVFKYSEMKVLPSMIAKSTLVQFKPKSTYCSKQTSNESCTSASTSDIVCHWCQSPKLCGDGADINTNKMNEMNCINYNNFKVPDGHHISQHQKMGSVSHLIFIISAALIVVLIAAVIVVVIIQRRKQSKYTN
uniref:Egg protein CP391S n=1 Tax=Schistosoma japonicum TaxID=6182 RepID=C1LFK3_SCHJA|nr:Egg protein CP391S [Schistosoma japonicum]